MKYSSVALLSFFCIPLLFGGRIAISAEPCNGPDVVTITRPFYPDQKNSPTFEFAYRYVKNPGAGATLIYLPGGPGQTSMKDGLPQLKGFNVIYTDPRGVGCNESSGTYPDDFYTTENLASDVIAVIRNEKLSNYVIYGTSYGTLLGTVVTSKINVQADLAQPRSLLLEGVMGRGYLKGEADAAFALQWLNLKKRLPDAVRAKINADAWQISVSPSDLGTGISSLLPLGKGMLDALMTGLVTSTDSTELSVLEKIFKFNPNSIPESVVRLHRNISCREIWSDQSSPSEPDRLLVHGDLIPGPHSYCDGIPFSNPFDASHWQVTTPIYYFVGEDDPATPLSQAEYHFKSERNAKRILNEVMDGAGHGAVTVNLTNDGCAKSIFTSLVTDETGFQKSIGTCKILIRQTTANQGS